MTERTTPDNETSRDPRSITVAERLLILVATALVLAAILRAEPLQSANDRSRWATVWSLVERGTFQIDEIDYYARWSTIDKVRYRASDSEPWHFYSSKPPLLSTIVAGMYWVERWTLGYGLFNHTAFVTRLLLLIVNGLPFWFALRSLCRCLILLGASLPARLFVVAVAGFGSLLNPYLTSLNNHTPAAACAMLAITAAAQILAGRSAGKLSSDHAGNGWAFAVLGFFAALTCCFELPAALLGVLSFVLVVIVNRKRAFLWYVPAAVVPLAAFFITNWMATGGVKPFYATYGTETYVYEHNGIPSYWMHPRDLDANQESTPVYLFHCLLGHHGLLSLTPVLCLAIVGWVVTLQRNNDAVRKLLILSGAMLTLATLSFYLTRTQNYNYGGNSVGLRWMLWLTPFWWISIAPAVERIRSRVAGIVCGMLLLVSIVSVSWSMDRPWRPSWLYEQMESLGWINYRTKPEPFPTPRTSVFGDMPREPGTSMTWHSSEGETLTITVDTEQPSETELQLAMMLGDSAVQPTLIRIDLRAWQERGEVWTRQPPSEASQMFERLVSGFPKVVRSATDPVVRRPFNPAGPTWIPSETDATKAWKIDRGAARVVSDDPVFGKCWYRCDVMYCDQLPFGVLQWKTQTSLDSTGAVIQTTTWTAEPVAGPQKVDQSQPLP
ncbi:MAG TPA: hypothetical protein PLR25_23665 [Planctomycetaceae bacterium]|nr:hypothetical protein [Planctomycetaceae bacterium]